MNFPYETSYLRCLVAGETYCLEMAWVREVVPLENLGKRTATDTPGCLGRVRVANTTIEVFALETLLYGTSSVQRQSGRIIVLQRESEALGILVSAIESPVAIPDTAFHPLPAVARSQSRPFFAGVIVWQDQLWLVLSPQGLHPDVRKRLAIVPQKSALPILPGILQAKTGKLVMFRSPARVTSQPEYVFAVSLLQVLQVLLAPPLVVVPGSADSVLGLIPWRRVPLAVIDLGSFLEGKKPAAPLRCILVVRATRTAAYFGVPIHPEIRIHSLPLPHRSQEPPASLQQSFVRGVFTVKHSTVVIPDIDAILASP